MPSIIEFLVVLALIFAFWALPKYLERRVAEAARGAVDKQVGKVLADYTHSLNKQLENHRALLVSQGDQFRQELAFQRELYSKDYSLFAENRNVVYARAYSLLERARGAYAPYFARITERRDFSQSPRADLEEVLEKVAPLTRDERERLRERIDVGDFPEAGKLATTLYERAGLRRANRAYQKFKNYWILQTLFFSAEVEAELEAVSKHLGMLSIFADELLDGDQVNYQERAEALDQVDNSLRVLRTIMRAEMRAGFTRDSVATIPASPIHSPDNSL